MIRLGACLILMFSIASCNSDTSVSQAIQVSAELRPWTDGITKSAVLGHKILADDARIDGWYTSKTYIMRPTHKDSVALNQKEHIQDGKLREVVLSFDTKEALVHEEMYAAMLSRFDSLYSPAKPAIGYATWKDSSANGTLIEVELIDAQELYEQSRVEARWKEHMDKRYEK